MNGTQNPWFLTQQGCVAYGAECIMNHWYSSRKKGWKPLCDFLGKPVPDEPYPRAINVRNVMSKYETLYIYTIFRLGVFHANINNCYILLMGSSQIKYWKKKSKLIVMAVKSAKRFASLIQQNNFGQKISKFNKILISSTLYSIFSLTWFQISSWINMQREIFTL